MNLHEYQSKQLLKQYGVPVPEGFVAQSAGAAIEVAKKIADKTGTNAWAVKAQVHAGGRGKSGGVKVAHNLEEVKHYAHDMLGMTLVTPQTGPKGKLVRKVLVEQSVYYTGVSEIKEFYLSILLNRDKGMYAIVYSAKGGMDIETVAASNADVIYTELIDTKIGLHDYQSRKIAYNIGLTGKLVNEFLLLLGNMFLAFEKLDASMIEVNPLVKTSDDKLLVADAKVVIDDNALYRQPSLVGLRDIDEEDPAEAEAALHGLNFVKLDGNVGCMVNGAGLAMATMDIIKLSGGNPANFLDVGGAASAKTVEAGFRIILKDKNVKAILVNIFGGIVRCDRVAQGIADAFKNVGEIKIPIIVRLQGTNAKEGRDLLVSSGLKVMTATTLEEAAELVKKAVTAQC
ncbi:MAG TPA: ADP-forming succinate--CoA ligase subunit beta [Bacteroidales bacterium]|nr:ADP-forming succinate--CoA ligase subunit beta [Bacteroidales bacterium]